MTLRDAIIVAASIAVALAGCSANLFPAPSLGGTDNSLSVRRRRLRQSHELLVLRECLLSPCDPDNELSGPPAHGISL